MPLSIGDPAPDFSLKDQNGQSVSLQSLRGKKVILYFYPQDDTPACTKEACSLRDGYLDIKEKNALIIGVSPDTASSHQLFIAKYQLPFTLLSDPDHQVMLRYDAYGQKMLYGRAVIGVKRSSFVIDEQGIITAIIRRVMTATHDKQIAKFL